TVNCRFTEFSRLPSQDNAGDLLTDNDGSGFIGACTFKDCFFWGGRFRFASSYGFDAGAELTLNNCQFSRTVVELEGEADYLTMSGYNNLFFGGSLTLNDSWEYYVSYFTMRDSVIDRAAYSLGGSIYLDADYNAYWLTNSGDFSFNTHEQVLTNISYAIGPLGIFYQQTTNIFTDHGSRRADQAGLYQYTILTNQVKEGSS